MTEPTTSLSNYELDRMLRLQHALLDFSSEVLLFVDPHGQVLAAVGAALGRMGHQPAEVRGRHIAELLHPDDLPAALEVLERARANPDLRATLQVRARGRGEEWLWMEAMVFALSVHPVLGDGAVIRLLQIEPDERERGTAASPESRFLSLAEALPSGILSADGRGRVVYCNSRAEKILDLSTERIIGAGWLSVVDTEDLPDVMEAAGLVLRSGAPQQANFRIQTGLFVRWAAIRFVPLGDSGQAMGWIATIDDVTDRRRAESHLAHQATHDPLTDLPNRGLLEDRLEQAFARLHREPGSISVLFCDLDGFKDINDTLGHDAGDEVLREVARRLRAVLRPTDTVARLGGDEFVAVCEGLGPDAVQQVAERVEEALAAPMSAGGRELKVGASVGVAITTDERQDALTLLASADQAMYRQKRRHGTG